MLAFKQAAQYPIDGLELDVQLSQDGQVVICHDERIDRTSDGQGYIKDLTLKELKQYHFNNGLPYEKSVDTELPTLIEFFEWFSETDLVVNIELKTSIFRYSGLIEKVVDLVNRYKLASRTIISSFHHRSVVELKKQSPDIKCGLLVAAGLYQPATYVKSHGCECYHPNYHSLDKEAIAQCHTAGIEVNSYTVNSSAVMKKLAKDQITSLITDDLPLVCATLKDE